MIEREADPYRGLLKGEYRRLSDIQTKVPYVKPALDTFLESGRVLGQHFFEDDGKQDVLLWYPEGVARKAAWRERSQHKPKTNGNGHCGELREGEWIQLPLPERDTTPDSSVYGSDAWGNGIFESNERGRSS